MTGPPGDRLRPGDLIVVRYLGHATVLLELPGLRILTDPFLRDRLGPLRRHGARPDPAAIGPVDVVLISHAHPDHFDRGSIAMLAGDPLLIVPSGLVSYVERLGRRTVGIAVGDTIGIGGGRSVSAVPARHWRWPGAPRAGTLGFLIEAAAETLTDPVGSQGRSVSPPGIYFAGDTARYAGMADFAGRVDLALLPVGSWGPHRSPGHLAPRSAARVAHDLRASIAIPIHWGTLYPPGLERLVGRRLTEPGAEFADWTARLGRGVDVRVLRPGEATTIDSRPNLARPPDPDTEMARWKPPGRARR